VSAYIATGFDAVMPKPFNHLDLQKVLRELATLPDEVLA
jgi:hypothetical protein